VKGQSKTGGGAMIYRFLRRLSVRQRIVGGFLILVALLAVSVPLIAANQTFLVSRLQQITDVETRADRLLLLASARVESSRMNVMRYIQDLSPSAYESLDDIDQAAQLLTEARDLVSSAEQKASVAMVLTALDDYKALIGNVEAARSVGESQNVSRLLFQAYRLGNDIGQRIEQIVTDSEARVSAANETIYLESRNRLVTFGVIYVVVLILALVMAGLIQRSISRPVSELRNGAESFLQGQMEMAIPVVGSDELSLLARTFNQMAAQLHDLIGTLEQQVADRTRDLERRAVELATAADVGRAAASILELGPLSRQVVDLVQGRFSLYYVGLFLLDEAGRYAMLEAGTGEAGRIMRQQGHRLEVGGNSMVGIACARRQARIALDVGAESVRFDNPWLPDTRSEMALPLMVGGRVLGALDLQSTVPAAFSAENIAVIQLVADQIAVAIQNARLFAEAQTALEAERRAYGQVSADAWGRLARSQSNLGYCSDEQGISLAGDRLSPEMDDVLRTGRIKLGQDGKKTLAAPVVVREQVVGIIDAQKPDGTREWTAEEIEMLTALSDQLGVALERARLYEDTQRRAARERLTSEATARMRETLDVEMVLKTAVDEISKALGLAALDLRLGIEGELPSGSSSDPTAA
jgi:GAF domain-containing protein/HAMP domain-containing protein